MPGTFPTIEAVAFPEWAKPKPFGSKQECLLAPDQLWPGTNEPAIGKLHPRAWGTDPEVRSDGQGGLHGWLNWPDPQQRGTQIAYMHSSDGLLWTVPRVVLTAKGLPDVIGYETPSALQLLGGRWVFAALEKQRVPDGRRDIIRFYTAEHAGDQWQPLPYTLEPELWWEQRWFSPRWGNMQGGLMEPALGVFTLGAQQFLVCMYTASTYANGMRPSTGVAVLPAGGSAFTKHPELVIWNSGQIDLEVLTDPDDGSLGFRAAYQHDPGRPGRELRCAFSRNLRTWSDPVTMITAGPDGSGDAYRTVGPCLRGDRLWWWGEDEKAGANSILTASPA